MKEPFYTDQYEQEHLKPPVASLLLSADLYCRAASFILKNDPDEPLLGHDAVIQALAQRGLHVTDHDRIVTERDLRKRPLQMVGACFFCFLIISCVCFVMYIVVRNAFFWSLTTLWAKLKITNREFVHYQLTYCSIEQTSSQRNYLELEL